MKTSIKERLGFLIAAIIFAAIAVLNFTEIFPFEFTLFEVISIGSKLTGIVCTVLALILLLCTFAGLGKNGGRWIKIIVVILAIAVAIIAFNNQEEDNAAKMEALAGTYTAVVPDSTEQAMDLLENIEAYEAEIALADLESLEQVKMVWFGPKGSYCFGYDEEATKACVREFYRNYFAALYAGRITLNEAYDTTFDDMSDTAFYKYYADLYGAESYDALLDHLAEIAYDYNDLKVPYETGTYEIKDGKIYLSAIGEEETYVDYMLEDDTLTLGFSNGSTTYKKAD